MAKDDSSNLLFEELTKKSLAHSSVIINKDMFIQKLRDIVNMSDLISIKRRILAIKSIITKKEDDREIILNIDRSSDTVSLKMDIICSELNQILEAHTIERAKYYINRLIKGLTKEKTNKINDINLLRWKEYDEIITDSLWILEKRDSSGAHLGWYWGNFVPQIPRQFMLRFTKKGDWVLDPFVGSGTTLIECRQLGRNGIGIELNKDIAERAKTIINREQNELGVLTEVIIGDSRNINIKEYMEKYKIHKFQLIIMHPPYHDIIKFSNNKNDLSNARNTDEFILSFAEVVDNLSPFLERGRYLVLVIGDKYQKGEWIPLGFYCMKEILKRNYILKGIIVKNFEQTRGKRNQQELWRYRALVGGFYVFKHEYIMLFKKK